MLGIHTKNLRGDLFGGLTAGVIALPLARHREQELSPASMEPSSLASLLRFSAVLDLKSPAQQALWWLCLLVYMPR